MKNQKLLRSWSILSFFIAIASLIVVDWYFHGYGLLIMFIFISFGLIFHQLEVIYFPSSQVNDYKTYKKNKLLKLCSLILFVMSPMSLIYGTQHLNKIGFVIFVLIIASGIFLDQLARIHYSYSIE